MPFKLIRHNRRGPVVREPCLSELLACDEPFIISSLPAERNKSVPYVFCQMKERYEFMLDGIGFLDHDQGLTYQAGRNERIFRIRFEGVRLPWHADKFGVYANRYGTGMSCSDLKDEFVRLGYFFTRKEVRT